MESTLSLQYCPSETWPILWHISLYFEKFFLIIKYFKGNWKM